MICAFTNKEYDLKRIKFVFVIKFFGNIKMITNDI